MANYRALPQLKFDGQPAPEDLMTDIVQIVVEENVSAPDNFTIVLKNDYQPGRSQDATWRHKNLSQIGTSVTIGFTSSTNESKDYNQENSGEVCQGTITAIETNFNNKSQAPVIVRGYDDLHLLTRGTHTRSFQNVTDSDIVRKIVEGIGIKIGIIEDSGTVRTFVCQANQTDLDFFKILAARSKCELRMENGKFYFCKAKLDKQPLTLTWLTDLTIFRVKADSAEQVCEIEGRSYSILDKKPIVAKYNCERPQVPTKIDNNPANINQNFRGKKIAPKITLCTTGNPQAVSQVTESFGQEVAGKFVEAYGKCEGNPLIRPGRTIHIKGMGQYSGEYYINSTRHVFCDGVYTTEFSVRSSQGLKALANSMSHMQLKPGQTFLVGIVTHNEDPNGFGRVKVKFPTLTDEHTSNWARIVAPGAGANRGVYWMPEINDEVLVGFEQGDIHRPYIIGGVWNGKDPTPKSVKDTVANGSVRVRGSRTRSGHSYWFVDEDKGGDKRGYYVKTASGHSLKFNDTEQYIEIETMGHHKIRLDDKGKFVEIKTSGGQSLRLDDTNSSASIQSSGNLSIQAQGNIDITSKGTINIQGATIRLN